MKMKSPGLTSATRKTHPVGVSLGTFAASRRLHGTIWSVRSREMLQESWRGRLKLVPWHTSAAELKKCKRWDRHVFSVNFKSS